MYDEETECGVLTDFDLSLLQWEPRVFGTDRTGTIPFMALDLLTPRYWDGKFKRYYHHELEAFIWILCYVFLLYQNSERQTHRKVDLWRTSSYEACHKEKSSFLTDFAVTDDIEDFDIKADFKDCWPVADYLLLALIDQRSVAARRRRHPQGTPQTRVIPEELQDAADLWQRWGCSCAAIPIQSAISTQALLDATMKKGAPGRGGRVCWGVWQHGGAMIGRRQQTILVIAVACTQHGCLTLLP